MCDDPSDPETTEDVEVLRQQLLAMIDISPMQDVSPGFCSESRSWVEKMSLPRSEEVVLSLYALVIFFKDPFECFVWMMAHPPQDIDGHIKAILEYEAFRHTQA